MSESEGLRHIRNEDLVDADPTPGIHRRQAIASDRMWAGLAHADPGMVSGWHHHGQFETAIYVMSGELRMEYGPGGRSVLDVRPGDFIHVPPHTVHREGNPTNEVATLVLVRAGQGAPTINVDGPESG